MGLFGGFTFFVLASYHFNGKNYRNDLFYFKTRLALNQFSSGRFLQPSKIILKFSEGNPKIVILDDGWTAVSEDESRAAQFEHTILITETGFEILT